MAALVEQQQGLLDAADDPDTDPPAPRPVLTIIRAMEVAVPADQVEAHAALRRLANSYAYKAPELHGNVYRDLYEQVVIPHLAPHQDAEWTPRVQEIWRRYNLAAGATEEGPESAAAAAAAPRRRPAAVMSRPDGRVVPCGKRRRRQQRQRPLCLRGESSTAPSERP